MIDDEDFVLKLLGHQLNNLGFSDVVFCLSGTEAMSILERDADNFHLIMCDLVMPNMDGIEFLRHLSGIEYAGGLILVSGEDERILGTAETLAKSHNINVLGVLQKPILPELLMMLLDNILPKTTASPKNVAKSYSPDELQKAIKNGELINYYQPLAQVKTGKIVGVETLVRWQHPDAGLIYPDQFVAMAETHNLINDLTNEVLSGAIEQLRLWQAQLIDLHVSVNISVKNLSSLQFPDQVSQALDVAGVSPKRLILEVTESRLMANPLSVIEILTRVRLKNIGLSIDDFGTGHSSLAQLRDIPFDELKIDKSFVHGAYHDTALHAIFEGSLKMAKQLGIKVVAEGVENIDDWTYLQKMDCDLAQGYFIARPMPADEFEGWLIEWEERRNHLH
ncbi:MAG: EAL domain-containing protein (putative c-di-GMP-specific phosphodiesterase class I) [Porticoccus sp.]